MLPRSGLLTLLAVAASSLPVAPPASAGFAPGGPLPSGCVGDFVDRTGTQADDFLVTSVAIGARAERLYGLDGNDRMAGGNGQGSCLFGGKGTDNMTLGEGGGVLLGEEGSDLLIGANQAEGLLGGPGPDALAGMAGDDVLRGDSGVDGFSGGPGDDVLLTEDGRRELVLCGTGRDQVKADAFDALFNCERRRVRGSRLPERRVGPERGIARTGRLDVSFRAPSAGAAGKYVLIASRCSGVAPRTLATLPARGARVRAGQRVSVTLRAPRGGWCRGGREVVVNRRPDCRPGRCLTVPPLEPLERLRLKVR